MYKDKKQFGLARRLDFGDYSFSFYTFSLTVELTGTYTTTEAPDDSGIRLNDLLV